MFGHRWFQTCLEDDRSNETADPSSRANQTGLSGDVQNGDMRNTSHMTIGRRSNGMRLGLILFSSLRSPLAYDMQDCEVRPG